jgi:hypothetical protein
MSLPVNNKKASNLPNQGGKSNNQNSKFIPKAGKPAPTISKKPIKTGGSRGS